MSDSRSSTTSPTHTTAVHQRFLMEGTNLSHDWAQDPFYDPPSFQLVGHAVFALQGVQHGIEVQHVTPIANDEGTPIGHLDMCVSVASKGSGSGGSGPWTVQVLPQSIPDLQLRNVDQLQLRFWTPLGQTGDVPMGGGDDGEDTDNSSDAGAAAGDDAGAGSAALDVAARRGHRPFVISAGVVRPTTASGSPAMGATRPTRVAVQFGRTGSVLGVLNSEVLQRVAGQVLHVAVSAGPCTK